LPKNTLILLWWLNYLEEKLIQIRVIVFNYLHGELYKNYYIHYWRIITSPYECDNDS
jgi:hypothetical protein